MPLASLVLSRDSQEVAVCQSVLGSLRIDVEIGADPVAAWVSLNKSKFDAVIVDCDLEGADGFLGNLHGMADPGARPVILVTGSGERSRLDAAGGEFVLQKPISVEQAVHTFSAARNLILKARLQYHRQNMDAPISITDTNNANSQIQANLLNLSQKGIRVRMEHPRPLAGEVAIHFLLPGTELEFDAEGEVAWADARGNAGIRLVNMPEPARRDLRLWLERQYFQAHGS